MSAGRFETYLHQLPPLAKNCLDENALSSGSAGTGTGIHNPFMPPLAIYQKRSEQRKERCHEHTEAQSHQRKGQAKQ